MMGNRRKATAPHLRLVEEDKGPLVQSKILRKVDAPDDEKEVIKEVPAKVDGVTVGTAVIYDDGSVDIIIDESADPTKVELIKKLERDMGLMGFTSETE